MTDQSYPTFDAPNLMIGEEVETLQDVYAHIFNFEEEKLVVTGTGKAVKSSPVEAYRFWAIKCCLTERYQYAAYGNDFGVEFEQIIKANYPRAIAESEIKRTITEALMIDSRTISVSTFSFEWEADACQISFFLESVYGIDNVEIQRGGELSGRVHAT